MKKLVSLVLTALLITTLLVGCAASPATPQAEATDAAATAAATDAGNQSADTTAPAPKVYKIALSNAYMGNDWRQEMLKVAQVIAEKEPYASKVELTIVNVENTPEAQSASIDDMVQQGYDAILIDAASGTALNPAIQRALDKNIVVVTFDSVVDMDGVYTVQTDLASLAQTWANFLIAQLPKGANVAFDIGLPGLQNGFIINDVGMKALKDAGINIVATFAGEWSDGVGQQQLSSVLAANPDLDGIFSQVYGETILAAFQQAGRELIPCTAFMTNAGCLAAIDNKMPIIIGNNIPGLSAIALDVAVRVLDGETVTQDTLVAPGQFVNDTAVDVGVKTTLIEEGVNCFRDLPGAFDWPVLPDDFATQIKVEEIQDYQQ